MMALFWLIPFSVSSPSCEGSPKSLLLSLSLILDLCHATLRNGLDNSVHPGSSMNSLGLTVISKEDVKSRAVDPRAQLHPGKGCISKLGRFGPLGALFTGLGPESLFPRSLTRSPHLWPSGPLSTSSVPLGPTGMVTFWAPTTCRDPSNPLTHTHLMSKDLLGPEILTCLLLLLNSPSLRDPFSLRELGLRPRSGILPGIPVTQVGTPHGFLGASRAHLEAAVSAAWFTFKTKHGTGALLDTSQIPALSP